MKIWNRVMQAGGGQVGEQLLELAKGARRCEGLRRGLDCVVGLRIFNKDISAPVVAGRIQEERLAGAGWNQG